MTKTSERRLSDVARRLVKPVGITGSYWPDVADTCANKLGITFDGWQDGAGGLILAHREDGALAHTVGGVGISICRQTGKTFLLAGLIFGLCIDKPGLLVIWSAHHSRTHNETFIAMQGYAKRTLAAPYISKVYTGSGVEEIRFGNGSRILFGARERGFGRGVPAVDVLVFDEGQILSERAMQNMVATMNVSLLGLHIYCGTPPKPEDNSELFMRMREEALAGVADDLLWIEFGADEGTLDLDDQEQWAKANPSFPHRTPLVSIQRLRRKLDDAGFAREALGLYDTEDPSVFDLEKWHALADMEVEPPNRVTLMIDVAPDRRWSSIGIAGDVEVDGHTKTLLMCYSLRGTSTVVPKVVELMEKREILEVSIFAGGQARMLKPDLVKAEIEFEELHAADMGAAQAALQEAVKAGTVVHVDQPELNMAVANARTRFLMSGESEQIDRRTNSIDLSPVMSVAGAFYRYGMVAEPMPFFI